METTDLPFDGESPEARRILQAARQHLFKFGYQALTMDDLAHELGISKKTLYVHFPGKDAIIGKIITAIGATMRARMDPVLADPERSFAEKLAAFVEVAGSIFSTVNPTTLRDLQRFAPPLYQRIEEIRQVNIPYIFGRLIRGGIAEGKVRGGVDPAFAAEFWLHALRGLVQPATLERTQLTLRQTLNQALDLYLCGLLTPAGRKDYEKHRPS
ncbi:MAG: TetR/AcrR family transcriptional regulator [Verrucomicrobia bacterium]|nr:TetR/AcrR family transcriptional regulator [Verrucomicrobiota bacterium]